MLQPLRRRTWAPVGQTPVQCSWDRHDRLTMTAALTFSPQARRPGVFFRIYDENLKTPGCVDFLTELHRHFRKKIVIIWDRLNVHRAAAKLLLERHPNWFDFEFLPPYAPELNPVEQLWNHTKYAELSNMIPTDIEELRDLIDITVNANRQNFTLLRSFLRYTKLTL